MSYLQKQMKAMRFDKRLIEINLKTQVITEADYTQHIAHLDDRKSVSETLKLFRDGVGQTPPPVFSVPTSSLKQSQVTPPQPARAADPFGSGY